jgi:hypothetical protein
MNAWRIHAFGSICDMTLDDVAQPEISRGEVLI